MSGRAQIATGDGGCGCRYGTGSDTMMIPCSSRTPDLAGAAQEFAARPPLMLTGAAHGVAAARAMEPGLALGPPPPSTHRHHHVHLRLPMNHRPC